MKIWCSSNISYYYQCRKLYIFEETVIHLLDYVSHSGHAPMMTISVPSMISKWENLQNSRVFKYLFSSLYIQYIFFSFFPYVYILYNVIIFV